MSDRVSPQEQAVAKIIDDMLRGLDFSSRETIAQVVEQIDTLLAKTDAAIKTHYAQLRVMRYFEARLHSIRRDAVAQQQAMIGAGPFPTFEDANASRIAGIGGPQT